MFEEENLSDGSVVYNPKTNEYGVFRVYRVQNEEYYCDSDQPRMKEIRAINLFTFNDYKEHWEWYKPGENAITDFSDWHVANDIVCTMENYSTILRKVNDLQIFLWFIKLIENPDNWHISVNADGVYEVEEHNVTDRKYMWEKIKKIMGIF